MRDAESLFDHDLSEGCRRRLIGDLANVLKSSQLPPEARQAGLTLIGWLARRFPHDTTPPDDGTRR
jgi:hypothetical protein